METFPTTTTHLVALLVVVLGDRHNPFAQPLDQAPRLLQMMDSTKRLDVQAGPSTRNTSAVISGHVRYQRSSNQAYSAKQQPPDTRRKASAPQMLSEPDRTYRAREGEAVYMECSVLAWPPATILWFRNYRSLKIEGERYQIFENGTLRILDLRREDSDTYTCFATNNLNNDLLRAHLSVEVVWDGEGDEDDEEEYDEYEEEDEENEEEEEEDKDDGKEASSSSPSAPNAGSGRGGGADEDEGELSATSPAATAAATTTSAGRAAATSEASCRLGAAWSTALLLTLVPPLARGAWHRGGV